MGCTSRSAECHSSCTLYAEYRVYMDAVKADKEARRKADEYVITQIARRRRKNGKR